MSLRLLEEPKQKLRLLKEKPKQENQSQTLLHKIVTNPIVSKMLDYTTKVMSAEQWEQLEQTEKQGLKDLGEFLTTASDPTSIMKMTPEKTKSSLRGIAYLLKPLGRMVEPLRTTIGARIEGKGLEETGQEAIKGFLKPEEVEPLLRNIPFQEWEQGHWAKLIPRAVAEAIEHVALYQTVFGRPIKRIRTAIQKGEMAQIEKTLPIWEKAGVKFPSGMSNQDKVTTILQTAQTNPQVGQAVRRIIQPLRMYAGVPVKVGDLVRIGQETGKVLSISGAKAVLSIGGKEVTKALSELTPTEPTKAPPAKDLKGKVPIVEEEGISTKVEPRLIQAKQSQLESELIDIDRQMRILEDQKARFEKQSMPTGQIDTQLRNLSAKYDYIDSSIAELMVGQTKVGNIRKEVGQMKIGELLRKEERIEKEALRAGKKIGITEEKIKTAEAKIKERERKALRTEVNKYINTIKKVDTSEMSPINKEAIEEVKEVVDFTIPTKKTFQKLERTNEYLQNNPDAELPDYVYEDLKRLDKLNRNNMTIEQLRSLAKQVQHHAHLEKVKNKIKVGREIRRAQQVLDDSIKEMKPFEKIKSNIVTSQTSKIGKYKKAGRLIKDTFGIRHDHYDLVVETLAGANSTMDKVLYQEIKEGIIKQLKYRQNVFRQFQEDLVLENFMTKHNIKDIGAWQNERVTISKWDLTRGERMALYRHSLNENNLRHIVSSKGGIGFKYSDTPYKVHKITQEEVNAILDNLTEAEKEFASLPIANLFDNQHRALNEVFYAKNGYELPKESNYYPIEVMKTTLPKDLEAESILEELKNKWVRIGLKKGMLENRTKSELPIYLNALSYDVNKSIMNAAAYVGLEMPLSNASKLLYNKAFRAQIYNRYGEQTWKEIDKGLRDIAGDWQSYTTTEEILLKLKNNLTTAILGINPFVALKQILSYSLYSVYIKPQYLLQGFIDHTTHPLNLMERHKMYSPEYVERVEGGYSRDVADIFKTGAEKKLYKGKGGVKEKLMGGIKLLDLNAVNPGMQGAVLQVLDELKTGEISPEVINALDLTGIDVAKLAPEEKMKLAYQFADYVTERTQPMFSPEHRSSLSRGSTIEKLATQFSSFTNQALNLIRRTYRETQRTGDPKMYAKLSKVLFMLFVVNAGGVMAIDNLRNWMFGRKERKGYGEAVLDSASSFFYFIRDLESSVVSKVKRGTFMGYDISLPVLTMANTIGDTIADGIGSLLDDTSQKRSKRAAKFIDNSLSLTLMSMGIPYQTPKKIVKGIIGGESIKGESKGISLKLLGSRTGKKLRLLQ